MTVSESLYRVHWDALKDHDRYYDIIELFQDAKRRPMNLALDGRTKRFVKPMRPAGTIAEWMADNDIKASSLGETSFSTYLTEAQALRFKLYFC